MAYAKKYYKYVTYSHYSLQSLINGTVWLSKPGCFNDPFDCQHVVQIDNDTTTLSDISTLKAQLTLNAFEIYRLEDALRKADAKTAVSLLVAKALDMGVYCLSTVNNNHLMWGHYSASHYGFVIEYDIPDVTQFSNLVPVRYHNNYPPVKSGDLIKNFYNMIFELATYKGSLWAYENEWRFLDKEGARHVPRPWPISGIIFGYKMPLEQRQSIRNILNTGTSFYTSRISDSAYEINIDPC